MTNQMQDLQFIVERLEKVEKQNHKLMGAVLAAIVLVGAVLAMGQRRPIGTFEAREFIVRDEQGQVRAAFGIAPDGFPSLEIFSDKEGGVILTPDTLAFARDGKVIWSAPR